ncbi:Uncharacterized conserved protein HemY, contains two TPR repeats [Cognatiyoonia koreensis]|uniref:Uncharacterized conserved protein HemY, contains two TPR repeats n=1 Tax=Cognatiyoonia koreensis TaxID=364200 RepID=A0A1I0RSI6_9RHOB|nr:tetratricopeptide repeat protein [Cognatiyoonia koreensis]SEW44226.1 Uncharacterized conserved protein HemY, contains two TPR repeats [Cognatiyoonia koreensis]
MRRLLKLSAAILLAVFLTACESAEERAQGHYENALELLEQGDPSRAVVELRNALQNVPAFTEARYELARIYREDLGRVDLAYGEYLRVAEQLPESSEARIALSEMAFQLGSWDELQRHGEEARTLAPDDQRVKAISAALDYRAAVVAEDTVAMQTILDRAEDLYDPQKPNLILREMMLEGKIRSQEFRDALVYLDDLIADFPDKQRYYRQRLQVLIALGDDEAIEEQLQQTITVFPDDPEQKATLLRFYLSRGELDEAEAFLRQLIANAQDDEAAIAGRSDLIRFLSEFRSTAAARAEIAVAIQEAPDPAPFIVMAAGLDFASGQTDKAIQDIEKALAENEDSVFANPIRLTLAEMLLATGNDVGSRALVETVLVDDPSNAIALRMSARWLIDSDETDQAIAALRTALDTDPEDVVALTLMAEAHGRNGSSNLERDFLALAVEASGNAPEPTNRYARVLISEERYLPAEDILLPALRIAPNNIDLLRTAGELYLAMEDYGRIAQVIDTLRRLDTDPATNLANQLEAERLNRQSGIEEAVAFLQDLASGSDGDLSARILLLQAQLSGGETEAALALAEEIVSEDPEAPGLQLLLASTMAATGDLEGAIEIYETVSTEFPDNPNLRIDIARLQARNGDPDAADATLNAALEQFPDDVRLLWFKASTLETEGDIEGAIAIYEKMYEERSDTTIVANNLASLLSTYRSDEESLERAWRIARRFRDAEVPALQDTYGWLTHLRGQTEEALPYLESAAAGLPEDPIVQFHYAEALYALGDLEAAIEQYRSVVDLAGLGDSRPQIEAAQGRVAEIEATLSAPE